MGHVEADLRAFEANQDRIDREWERLTVSEKCRRVVRTEFHPLAHKVLHAYIAHENDYTELGRVIALFLNDQIDEMY